MHKHHLGLRTSCLLQLGPEAQEQKENPENVESRWRRKHVCPLC